MFNLLGTVMQREMDDGTFQPRRRDLQDVSFGKKVNKLI
jgi:hypothetical protein